MKKIYSRPSFYDFPSYFFFLCILFSGFHPNPRALTCSRFEVLVDEINSECTLRFTNSPNACILLIRYKKKKKEDTGNKSPYIFTFHINMYKSYSF